MEHNEFQDFSKKVYLEVRKLEVSLFHLAGGDREKANDLAGDTILRALEKKDLYDPSQKLGPWIYKIAYSLFISGPSGTRRERTKENYRSTVQRNSTGIEQERISDRMDVQSAFGMGEKSPLRKKLEGYNINEIAKLLNCTTTQAKTRIGKEKKLLKNGIITQNGLFPISWLSR